MKLIKLICTKRSILLLIGMLMSNTALAEPRNHFSDSVASARDAVESYFSCDKTHDLAGTWTCETKIDIGQGLGLVDLRVGIKHRPMSPVGGVVSYTFKIPRQRLIRDTSFRGVVGLARFFGTEASTGLSTHANYKAYLRGQDIFEVQGLTFEAIDSSSGFELLVHETSNPKTRLMPFSTREVDETGCDQVDGLPGWQASWSHEHASIEPAFRPVSPDLNMVTGKFWIRPDGVMLSFEAAPEPLKSGAASAYIPANRPNILGAYVTLLVDTKPVYQGQWIETREPRCCTRSVKNPMLRDLLFAFADGRQGMIILSEDAKGQRVIAASHFDLANMGKAADLAIGGKFERSRAKQTGRCG